MCFLCGKFRATKQRFDDGGITCLFVVMGKARLRNMTQFKIIFASIAVLVLTECAWNKDDTDFADDFLKFWTDVRDNYAYFHKKHTDWNQVKTVYLPQAKNAKNRDELISVL